MAINYLMVIFFHEKKNIIVQKSFKCLFLLIKKWDFVSAEKKPLGIYMHWQGFVRIHETWVWNGCLYFRLIMSNWSIVCSSLQYNMNAQPSHVCGGAGICVCELVIIASTTDF